MSNHMMYNQPPYRTLMLEYFTNDGNRPPIGCKMMVDVQPYDVQSTTILHSHALVYLTNDGNRPPIVVHYTN